MAESACKEPVPYGSMSETDPSNANMFAEFDSLPLPPLDPDIFSDDLTLPDDFMADLGFDDDFNFSFGDDLSVPTGNQDFLPGNGSAVLSGDAARVPSSSQESDGKDGYSGSGVWSASQIIGDRSTDVGGFFSLSSPETGSCNQDLAGAVSSQDSGGSGSGVSGFMDSPSPDSGICDRDNVRYALSCPDSRNSPESGVADEKIKLEEEGKACMAKRKIDKEEQNANPRTTKFRRSENVGTPCINSGNDQEDKKKTRLMRNRESALLSRQRKKHYIEELEDKVRSMHSTISELNGKISYIMAENASLRQQLGSGGMCPPSPGMYPGAPMAPMPYPWIPCPPYAMRPQCSQVPLVPIPRLKPQQPVSASKGKKSEGKKSESKTKKVASISFLGFFFFLLLFGGLVPLVNMKYGGIRNRVLGGFEYENNWFNGQNRGRILTVSGYKNVSDQDLGLGLCTGKYGFREGDAERMHCTGSRAQGPESEVKQNEKGSKPLSGADEFVRPRNATEPLVATLYVPRNDKLVKIDGNLIIHSVLASEKAMASSHAVARSKSDKNIASSARKSVENGLAIARDLAPALAVPKAGRSSNRHHHLYGSREKQNALPSGTRDSYKDNLKSNTADGPLQQWFREGLAGPMLSSGMCTEVFHFDIAPSSANHGAIIPANSVPNSSAEHPPRSEQINRRNRRILYRSPIPLAGSALNKTEERRPPSNGSFQGNRSLSPMVVSVLVDPKEAGDSENDGVMRPKSLSRIFVVVLLDSVKYVTYSCVLPLKGSIPHLVTA